MLNIPQKVLEHDHNGDGAQDIGRGRQRGQGSKIANEGQEHYWKEQNPYPYFDVECVGNLAEFKTVQTGS